MSNLIDQLLSAHRVAVIGVSENPSRPSHAIAQYLIEAGYEVFPVNPALTEVLGRKCYASLRDVPGPIDLVNVFRRPEFIPEIVREAIEVKAGGVWVQSGIRSFEGKQAADAAYLPYIEDHCIMVEHAARR